MSQIVPFQFAGSLTVRSLVIDGNPWFVAVDVCKVLEISNTSDALKGLDSDEILTLAISEGQKTARSNNLINESGLYSLILRSRKPQAKAFKKWVTSEVLPALRKTGTYSVQPKSSGRLAQEDNALRGSLSREFYPPWPLSDRQLLTISRAEVAELSRMVNLAGSYFRYDRKATYALRSKIETVFGAIIPDLEAWQYPSVRDYLEKVAKQAEDFRNQVDSLERLFWEKVTCSTSVALVPERGQAIQAARK